MGFPCLFQKISYFIFQRIFEQKAEQNKAGIYHKAQGSDVTGGTDPEIWGSGQPTEIVAYIINFLE